MSAVTRTTRLCWVREPCGLGGFRFPDTSLHKKPPPMVNTRDTPICAQVSR